MRDCPHQLRGSSQPRGGAVSCQRNDCEGCGWNPKFGELRRAELRSREQSGELVDRALMARSLAAFACDMDYGLIDYDSEGHPVWRKSRVY